MISSWGRRLRSSRTPVRPPRPLSKHRWGDYPCCFSVLSTASAIRRSMSCGTGRPSCSMSLGYILMAVKPGKVLISLMSTRPVFFFQKEIAPCQTLAVQCGTGHGGVGFSSKLGLQLLGYRRCYSGLYNCSQLLNIHRSMRSTRMP